MSFIECVSIKIGVGSTFCKKKKKKEGVVRPYCSKESMELQD